MNSYRVSVYIFGETHEIEFKAKETLEELKSNHALREKYVMQVIDNEIDIDNNIKQYK